MKKIFVLLFITTAIGLSAQDNYVYPQFVNAQVYYKNSSISAFINYNLFTSEILVMEGNKKQRLANVDKIEYISAGADRYIPLSDNVFAKILVDGGLILAMKYYGNVETKNSSIQAISKSAANKLLESGKQLPDGVFITVDSSFYFYKQRKESKLIYLPGTNVERASHSGILKLFSKHKSKIDVFIQNNDTDFSSFESLKKLVEFCDKYID